MSDFKNIDDALKFAFRTYGLISGRGAPRGVTLNHIAQCAAVLHTLVDGLRAPEHELIRTKMLVPVTDLLLFEKMMLVRALVPRVLHECRVQDRNEVYEVLMRWANAPPEAETPEIGSSDDIVISWADRTFRWAVERASNVFTRRGLIAE